MLNLNGGIGTFWVKRRDEARLVEGTVKALVDYGFDSVKLDSGFFVGRNLTLWADALNKSGR